MSIHDFGSADPLQRFAEREDVDEVYDVVRTVVVAGRHWKYYRLEVVRRYAGAVASGPNEYAVLAYVEDVLDVERTLDAQHFYRGQTRIWTRWTNFPDVRASDADTALDQALRHLAERTR